MKIFLVGGAVRDKLLNYPVIEKDWVVIGETPESMLSHGFRLVGKDFPVFLHPETQDEYALARMERKIGAGYKGFSVYASPEITLEQDLLRRDLTINAIAMDDHGEIFDPYNGKKDLEKRIFRHVSPAFSEDPVRILRVARFAARYSHLGFTIADETMQLMQQMVKAGEVEHLVAERVWAELHKALKERTPTEFFYCLKQCGALAVIFPELDRLYGVPQPEKYHPEIDTGVHSLLCLEQAAKMSDKAEVRLATLLHDLGKAETNKAKWPSHHGHEQLGLPVLDKVCSRLRIPKSFKTLSSLVMNYHTHCHRIKELKASTVTDMLSALSAFKPERSLVQDFVIACEADAKGRTGLEKEPYPQAEYLLQMANAVKEIDISDALNSGLQGVQIGESVRRLRIKAVASFIKASSLKEEC
jgi:tRNA nucleotidyltransferase (CCA-adding enzyme)